MDLAEVDSTGESDCLPIEGGNGRQEENGSPRLTVVEQLLVWVFLLPGVFLLVTIDTHHHHAGQSLRIEFVEDSPLSVGAVAGGACVASDSAAD